MSLLDPHAPYNKWVSAMKGRRRLAQIQAKPRNNDTPAVGNAGLPFSSSLINLFPGDFLEILLSLRFYNHAGGQKAT